MSRTPEELERAAQVWGEASAKLAGALVMILCLCTLVFMAVNALVSR